MQAREGKTFGNLCFPTLNIFVYVHEKHYSSLMNKGIGGGQEEKAICFTEVCHSWHGRELNSSRELLCCFSIKLSDYKLLVTIICLS